MKLDTDSVSNAQRYLREECPADARPYIRSLMEVVGAAKDINRLVKIDLARVERERDSWKERAEAAEAELADLGETSLNTP